MTHLLFWNEIGQLFYKYFHFLEWCYQHLTPNKVLMVIAACCMIWWLKWQNDYNKKAQRDGTYK